MTRAAVVQYHTTTVSTERNRRLIEDVVVELAARDPGGLHYQVFSFDEVGFLHLAVFDGTADPFADCAAYREFHRQLGDRLAAPPIVIRAVLIGSYPGRSSWAVGEPKAVVVQYQTRPDAAERNQQLIEHVFDELCGRRPSGLRYLAFRLEDGVGFVHVAISDGDGDPLAESAAFRRFQEGTGERLVGPPDVKSLAIVGSYGWHTQKEHQ